VFYTQTKTGPIGREITETAPQYENFIIIGDAEATLLLDENPAKNVVEFVYKYAPVAPSPTPEPSPSPEVSPSAEPSAEPPSAPPPETEPPASPSADPGLTPTPEETPPDWLLP
jgi:hypothetical protein